MKLSISNTFLGLCVATSFACGPDETAPLGANSSSLSNQPDAAIKPGRPQLSNPFAGLISPYLDIAYGQHEKQILDLHLPENVVGPTPLVIWIHGGGFMGGDKEQLYGRGASSDNDEGMLEYYLDQGIAVASIGYRLAEDAPYKKSNAMPYPAPMEDSARALQFLRFHSRWLNIDSNRVGLMGSSAGAQIAMWIAFHDDLARPNSPNRIRRESTRVNCVAPRVGQTSHDPREVSGLWPQNGSSPLPPSEETILLNFYGVDADDWRADPDTINAEYDASFREASVITHLSADDNNVKIFGIYFNELDDGVVNIHDPEFFRYLASGEPSIEGFERESLDGLGMSYEFYTKTDVSDVKKDGLDGYLTVLEYFQANCF